ncbi:hypothetical protein KOSB73_240250 [Klebsiella grimontii]|uniref:Uncharacterized protein n=1 Tax=Klebsiella grimontii TaxID=2058152 RepID=A0A285B2M7_9ENTR|nr:hypothetical protein KOSB73_240250 [Klebsiella grimontii]
MPGFNIFYLLKVINYQTKKDFYFVLSATLVQERAKNGHDIKAKSESTYSIYFVVSASLSTK